jgi:uncharacterized caspase-like protein
MTQSFTHGYALLIGVGTCQYAPWSLPATVKDVQALHAVLVDPAVCAYPADAGHVRVLHDDAATHDAILEGVLWLAERSSADPDATALIYYSGHGWVEQTTGAYYLIPHDVQPFAVPTSGVAAADFQTVLRAIPARRLLVIMDCCHAAGMATAKDPAPARLPPGFSEHALPKDVTTALRQGEGRAVLAASRGAQRSWVRPGGDLSLFTHHLLEALRGAASHPDDTVVRVSHLFTHLSQAVPASARDLCQAEQTPFLDAATEDFAVALLAGGKGLAASPAAPDLRPAMTAGDRGIAIGGANTGQVSTGDHVTQIQTR